MQERSPELHGEGDVENRCNQTRRSVGPERSLNLSPREEANGNSIRGKKNKLKGRVSSRGVNLNQD